MLRAKTFILYLIEVEGSWFVSNWPGTLKFPARVELGKRRFWNGRRVRPHYVKFTGPDGAVWYGKTLYMDSQAVRFRRQK